MKRCLNCRKTYDEGLPKCPFCGYKPRSKTVTTRRFDRPQRIEISSSSSPAPKQRTQTGKKNIYAASSHSGAFYIKSGERLNKRYSVINVMGFGAFGVAYECFDNYTKQHVVVKEFMPSYLVTRSSNGRDVEPISEEAEVKFSIGCDSFLDENEKLSNNHVECVPPLVECFRQNNTVYAVTELIGGEALSSILARKGKLSYETTAGIITSVLQGLRRLNRLGTIHGDICPENIIVQSEDKTYLLDYNLSDFNKNMYTQRESGKPRPGYSALEMYYKNMEIGPWTDVYAAAAVMYKMLTGIVIPTAVKRNTSDTLTPVSKLGVPISSGAEKAMFKALKIDYAKRTQSPEDFLNGFVGDGFDNITAVKGKKKNASAVPARRSSYDDRDGSGFLKGLLVFLTLAIIAVVIWFFISGVFPMPSFVEDFFGVSQSERKDSDTESKRSTDTQTDTDTGSVFRVSSDTESERSKDSDTSSAGLLDDIVSRVTSGIASNITSGINSFIDDRTNTSSEEERVYDDDGYYYDENGYYDRDGNFTPYNNGGDEQNNDGYEDNTSVYEDGGENNAASHSITDYVDSAASAVGDLIGGLTE